MVDPQLDRLLQDLDAARRAALARVDAALRGDVTPVAPRAIAPRTDGSPVAPHDDIGAPTPVDIVAGTSTSPRRPGRLTAAARTVAALVLTATAVLGGWLLVLEPALGSRPVLVRDEAMSPSLRTGDVALAVAPDGPLGAGAIVAVRADGRRIVTRVIGREEVPVEAGADARANAGLVVRTDAEPLEVTTVVPLGDVLGEVGAAVPRVGLPLVVLADPGRSPVGTLVVLALLGLTAVGGRDLIRAKQ